MQSHSENGRPLRAVKIQLSCQPPRIVFACALGVAEERQLPDAGEDHAVADVELGVAVVEHRVERVEVAQVVVRCRVRERRAQVVLGAASSVYFAVNCRPVFPSLRDSRPKVTPWYCDWPRLPRVLKAAYWVIGRWLAVADALVDERRAALVRVGEVVELAPGGAGVLDAGHGVRDDLALQRQAVEVAVGGLDVLVHVAQAAGRDRLGDAGDAAERALVVGVDRQRRRRRSAASIDATRYSGGLKSTL